MKQKKSKKVILFIVEGPTDEAALSPILKNFFQNDQLHFHIIHGDITTQKGVNSGNIISHINKRIKDEMAKYHYNDSDFKQIFHIIDTDGAFIPKEQVMKGDNKKIVYTEESILCMNPDKKIKNNHRKLSVVLKLCSTSKIRKIPYKILYFSRNNEHVLHNISYNLSSDEKMDLADKFAQLYENNPSRFRDFIHDRTIAVNGDYGETWNFIMKDSNSLKRFSNLHIIINLKKETTR